MTGTAAFTFFVYRTSLAYSSEIFFLEGDSWHKLSNIFLLIEYCSLIVYLARVPPKFTGYCLALGISIIVIFQEKDSFNYKYALGPLIFNNIVFISASYLLDHPEDYNMENIRYGGYWYGASFFMFIGTMMERIDYYFVFDDLFLACTCLSLFYSWQTYTDDVIELKEIWADAIHL